MYDPDAHRKLQIAIEAKIPEHWDVSPGIWAARALGDWTMGIAQDLGGSQPYIPVGAMLAASAKARRAMELLEQRASYRQVADATGLTESRVRQIEAEGRKQQMALRQGQLPLD